MCRKSDWARIFLCNTREADFSRKNIKFSYDDRGHLFISFSINFSQNP